jgi:hypothetical protein
MNLHRKDLRVMWKQMVEIYQTEGFLYRSANGRLAFRKVPYPLMELVRNQTRGGREDRL